MNKEEKAGMWIVLAVFFLFLVMFMSVAYAAGQSESCNGETYVQYLYHIWKDYRQAQLSGTNNYNNYRQQNNYYSPDTYN